MNKLEETSPPNHTNPMGIQKVLMPSRKRDNNGEGDRGWNAVLTIMFFLVFMLGAT
jgi:hypothetical protein